MASITFECPEALHKQLQELIREGWAADEEQILVEALRRYLDTHRPELMESQILADVRWGLHGKE